jgi:GNAT superfamily N-acetyltransferase
MGTLKQPKLLAPALISAEHDCSAFSCRHETLTEWLQRRALANQASGGSRTYVVCTQDKPIVIGYYALAPGSVATRIATGAIRRNMPSPVPVFVLGRLAVHRDWCGMGIGSGLLKDALIRCAQAAGIVGGGALLCHAIDDEAKAFYLKQGFAPSSIEPMTLMLGLKDIGKIL